MQTNVIWLPPTQETRAFFWSLLQRYSGQAQAVTLRPSVLNHSAGVKRWHLGKGRERLGKIGGGIIY